VSDPGDARQRRQLIVITGVLLLAILLYGIAQSRSRDDEPTTGLTIGWEGSEGHPSCVYDSKNHTVDAKIAIDGTASRPDKVTVTVTAYADENTSKPVGSGSRTVHVDGTVHRSVIVTVPVEKPPLVDIDGETACRLSVKYGHSRTPK
jgi:hypothetical protein